MQNVTHGRHRKPRPAASIAGRAAVVAGTAMTAVLVSTGAAGAVEAPNPLPCTGTPLDSVTKGVTGSYCGSGAVDSTPVG